jgi:hypothetical protein
MKKILCWSRAYLSQLFPVIDSKDEGREYYHIVQTNAEEKRVKRLGGRVILNIEQLVKDALINKKNDSLWCEPENFRNITGFSWSPIYSDRYLLNFDEDERLLIAGSIFNALDKLFVKYKFDYATSEPVALFTTHLLLYFCKKNDVKPRFVVSTYFPGYFFFSSNIGYAHPSPRSEKLSANELNDLKESIQNYCERVFQDKAGPVYHFSFVDKTSKQGYFAQRKGSAALILSPGLKAKGLQGLRLLRALFYKLTFPYMGDFQTAGSFKEHAFYFKCLFTSLSYYDSFSNTADNSVITYPLQYEPEASLLYAAPQFHNQVAFVENILRALPDNTYLYVKEHPNQFGALGLKPWRELRKKYHNIKFVYGRESGRELIKISDKVITISSTAGMDGVLLGKPVLIVGQTFYENYTNTFRVSSINDLATYLNSEIEVKAPDVVMEDVVENLLILAHDSYKGDPQPSDSLYGDENMKNLIEAFSQEFC